MTTVILDMPATRKNKTSLPIGPRLRALRLEQRLLLWTLTLRHSGGGRLNTVARA